MAKAPYEPFRHLIDSPSVFKLRRGFPRPEMDAVCSDYIEERRTVC
jgi:hypothetical protein